MENCHRLLFILLLDSSSYELDIFNHYNNSIPFAIKATEVKNNILDDLDEFYILFLLPN
jgi:hypothetical protein